MGETPGTRTVSGVDANRLGLSQKRSFQLAIRFTNTIEQIKTS